MGQKFMIICADDFGISPAVDDGILELIEAKVLTSTSCMMASLNIPTRFNQLKKFDGKIDIGLHLVFSDTKPLSPKSRASSFTNSDGRFYGLKELIKKSYLGQLQTAQIRQEIEAQIQSFVQIFGRPPDYIDGHQHVQALPVIREQLVEVLKLFPAIKYIRTSDLPSSWIRSALLRGLIRPAIGNLALKTAGQKASQIFSKNGFSHNRFLLGYWPLSSQVPFGKIFEEYLIADVNSDDIFFCHPGYVDDKLRQVDPLIEARSSCLEFLRSNEFTDICQSHKIFLNRFGKTS